MQYRSVRNANDIEEAEVQDYYQKEVLANAICVSMVGITLTVPIQLIFDYAMFFLGTFSLYVQINIWIYLLLGIITHHFLDLYLLRKSVQRKTRFAQSLLNFRGAMSLCLDFLLITLAVFKAWNCLFLLISFRKILLQDGFASIKPLLHLFIGIQFFLILLIYLYDCPYIPEWFPQTLLTRCQFLTFCFLIYEDWSFKASTPNERIDFG